MLVLLVTAALGVMPHSYAAVPVEESVEDSSREGAQSTLVREAPPSALPTFDIPPTIEPDTTPAERAVPQPVRGGPATGGAAAGTGQLSELFYQLQVLQQEIQNLRGQLEEQTYLVNRLQRDQREQYLDLDRRVMALAEYQPAPDPASTATPNPAASFATGGNVTEREAYTQAFEAMRAREFDASLSGFQQLIELYPNGQFTPNAYYWIGELYLVSQADAELARQSFMQVINLYPDHQKTPDALYKLGVVYHTLGDKDASRGYLERVLQDYPDSSAADLARKYLAEL